MTVPLPPKLYFRIGEVAGLVGVEPHVLRYWEREFRSIRPTKSAKGQRVYSRKDVEALIVVKDLLYAQGFTIAGAKKRLQRTPDVRVQPAASAAVDGAAEPAHAPPAPPSLRESPRPSPALEESLGELDLSHRAPAFSLGRSAEEALLMSAASVGSASAPRRPARAKTDVDRTRKVLISLRAEVETLLSELAETGRYDEAR